jgi:hypothetical protein
MSVENGTLAFLDLVPQRRNRLLITHICSSRTKHEKAAPIRQLGRLLAFHITEHQPHGIQICDPEGHAVSRLMDVIPGDLSLCTPGWMRRVMCGDDARDYGWRWFGMW